MSIGRVLLVDTLAGALILPSLTGVPMWTELNSRKTVGSGARDRRDRVGGRRVTAGQAPESRATRTAVP